MIDKEITRHTSYQKGEKVEETQSEQETIGVFLRNRPFFGAQITTLPALYFIYRNYNFRPISLFSRYELSWFYNQCPWVGKFTCSKNLLSDLHLFPKKSYAMISFQPSSERVLVIRLLKRPGTSSGFSYKNRIFNMIWDYSIPFSPNEYRAAHYLRLASQNSDKNDSEAFRSNMAAPFQALAELSCYVLENSSAKHRIAILPGGGAGDFKKWGLKNFLSLCQKISETFFPDAIFDFILGPDEQEELKYLKGKDFPNIAIHYSLPLADLSMVINQSELVISNDCGPSHIAQCLGKPYVGIYDKEKPEWIWQRNEARFIVPDPIESGISSIPVTAVESLLSELLSTLKKHPKLLINDNRKEKS